MSSVPRMLKIITGTGRVRRDREDARPAARDRCDEEEGHEGPEHEHLAVGEVDQLDDAVDEGIAQGDEREDHPVGETDDQGLDYLVHAVDVPS